MGRGLHTLAVLSRGVGSLIHSLQGKDLPLLRFSHHPLPRAKSVHMRKLNWIFKSQNVNLAKLKKLVTYVFSDTLLLIQPPMFLAAYYN